MAGKGIGQTQGHDAENTTNVHMITQPILALVSGGIDSVTGMYEMLIKEKGLDVSALMFDYGQMHWKELDSARYHCELMNVPWQKVEINRVFQGRILSSRLVGGAGPSDVIHNRNSVMLSIATAIAAASNIQMVAYFCNKDDSKMFPDCRPAFVDAMNAMNHAAEINVEIVTPYIEWTKKEIVERAREIGVDIDKTWSCYIGGTNPCGQCHACRVRAEAMKV